MRALADYKSAAQQSVAVAATQYSLASIRSKRGPRRGGTPDAPLLGPRPTPASREEEEQKHAARTVPAGDNFDRYRSTSTLRSFGCGRVDPGGRIRRPQPKARREIG